MKDTVFYFGFSLYDPDTEIDDYVNKGFVIRNFEFCVDDEDEAEKRTEEWLLVVDNFESQYGVHDWATSPDDRVDAIGLCSYEVKKDKIDELMEGWRQHFIDKGHEVTEVVNYIPNDEYESDYVVYQKILGRD